MRNTQNLQTAHLTRFGNPLNPNGVLYIASDQESLFEMEVDLILAKQSLFGQNVTLFDKVKIEEDIRRKQYTFNKKVSNEGIPKNVDFLLKQRKKSDTLKYCKKILITEFDLFILIHNCHRLKYEHKSKFLQYVPNHLVIKDEDTGKMKAGNALPFGKKVKSILKERRNINVHFFERETEWHCFFFSHKLSEVYH